jgi:hypothetical protein
MELHRVTWVDDKWRSQRADRPYHPLFVALDQQGGGRFDNPRHYVTLYAAATPQGAVGEAFGNSAVWLADEITRRVEGRPRCLVTYTVDDALALVDLDDANVLAQHAVRPSEVVRRNRERTQELGLEFWLSLRATGVRGVRWWSYWRPEWTVVALWSDDLTPPWFPFVTVTNVEPLGVDHPAVVLAADVLPRELG